MNKNKILNTFKKYNTCIEYSLNSLNNILDKQVIKKLEYKKNNCIMSLIYNDYGAFLRIWQNNKLECTLLRIKEGV